MPMLGVIRDTLDSEGGSISGELDFFSVARTMPFVADKRLDLDWKERVAKEEGRLPLIPKLVTPWFTALRAYSICTSLPLGEKVVREKE